MSFDVGSTLQEIESERTHVRTRLGQLDAAYEALSSLNGDTAPEPTPGRQAPPSSTPTRGRPRGSGDRARQAIKLVEKKPGITIPQIAKEMGIQPNYLYRVMPKLANDGTVRREGQGWHPVAA